MHVWIEGDLFRNGMVEEEEVLLDMGVKGFRVVAGEGKQSSILAVVRLDLLNVLQIMLHPIIHTILPRISRDVEVRTTLVHFCRRTYGPRAHPSNHRCLGVWVC